MPKKLGWTMTLLAVAATTVSASESPYLNDTEEAALCAFYTAQLDHFRDTGAFAPLVELTAGDTPYLDPAWDAGLVRYRAVEREGGFSEYWAGTINLLGNGGTFVVSSISFTCLTGEWLANGGGFPQTQRPQGKIRGCGQTAPSTALLERRVLDDLLSVKEALSLYWRVNGSLPASLEDEGLWESGYLWWNSFADRWGYQYAYASDGTDFSLAAWPRTPRPAGLRAFYLDQTGTVRASAGPGAGPDSEAVNEGYPAHLAGLGRAVRNEQAVHALMCEVYEAEQAVFAEEGRFTQDLVDLSPFLSFDTDRTLQGYNITLGGTPLRFSCSFNAEEYALTGYRGFLIDSSGDVRACRGCDAHDDSPIIGKVCEIDETFQPRGESLPGPARADADGDYRISLSELLALVQIFNLGEYHCGTDEPYAAGPGARACAPLEFDTAPADWALDLAELLRVIQLYNGGAYFPCPGSEDGLCVPLEPVF